ncbi:hypothetical protein C8R45DRAFT_1070029 [Mycena sanguinolenta]|nr:hypothetical protein C8R45DRAFT_1070029 [Mycena sanguinolenta]
MDSGQEHRGRAPFETKRPLSKEWKQDLRDKNLHDENTIKYLHHFRTRESTPAGEREKSCLGVTSRPVDGHDDDDVLDGGQKMHMDIEVGGVKDGRVKEAGRGTLTSMTATPTSLNDSRRFDYDKDDEQGSRGNDDKNNDDSSGTKRRANRRTRWWMDTTARRCGPSTSFRLMLFGGRLVARCTAFALRLSWARAAVSLFVVVVALIRALDATSGRNSANTGCIGRILVEYWTKSSPRQSGAKVERCGDVW